MDHDKDSAVHRVRCKNINHFGKDKQMKTTKMIAVLVSALGVMVLASGLAIAAPMGSAFTYQGRLILDGSAVTGEYDLQFKLYDSLSGGTQVGSTLDAPEVDVNEGYFTVLLDFGSAAFAGDARWLEIGVREGALEDPNTYDVFTPRQELTPAPYALYAASAPGGGGADSDWQISGTNMFSMPLGNVGIGTTTPSEKLDVNGQIRIRGGSPAAGRVLTSNGTGVGTWQTPAAAADSDWAWSSGSGLTGTIYHTGDVAVGTSSPAAELEVYRNNTATNSQIWVDQAGSGDATIGWDAGTQNYAIGIDNSDADKFKISNSFSVGANPRITIDTSGNVGIATTTPVTVLDVYGTDYIDATHDGIVNIGSSSGAHVTLDNNELHARNGSGTADLFLNDFGGNVFIGRQGRVYVGKSGDTSSVVVRGHLVVNDMSPTTSGSYVRWYNDRLYYYSSSKRYKQDIQPLREDFHKILQAEPKSFTCKTTGEKGIGYIAEEFDEMGLGSLVTYNNDGEPDALKYELVSLYLLEVLKDQVETTQDQAETIEQLQAKNQSLEQRVEALERLMQQQLLAAVKEVQQ